MTPLETLQKYGLKTDVKSIKERIEKDDYGMIALKIRGELNSSSVILSDLVRSIKAADLALLCELAEKGERYEKAVKAHREQLEGCRHTSVCAPLALNELDEIITEAEGE